MDVPLTLLPVLGILFLMFDCLVHPLSEGFALSYCKLFCLVCLLSGITALSEEKQRVMILGRRPGVLVWQEWEKGKLFKMHCMRE